MAVDIFLKIDGIDGESNDSKHKKEIEVISYALGVSRHTAQTTSSAGSHTTGKPDFEDLHIVKYLDESSPKLALACASGKHINKMRLEQMRGSGPDAQKFLDIDLEDVVVSLYKPGATRSDDIPTEQVSFHFAKITWTYTKTKVEGGGAAGSVATTWNLKTNADK